VNKLTKDIRLRVFALQGRNWGGLLESYRGNQTILLNVTKLLKNRHRAFLPLKSGNSVYVTNSEKSNLIAKAFSNVHESHDFNFPTTQSETVD
jgi:hypothetical protein